MLRLRLFHRDDPGRQLDSRPLGDTDLVIGRDAKADWPISDPERGISRRHLTVANRGGMITVRDTSSNGVFLGDARERIDPDRPTPIGLGDTVRFGSYILVVEEDRQSGGANPALATPFDDVDDAKQGRGETRKAPKHPYSSALKPDPFTQTQDAEQQDAWERKPDDSAGSWNATAPTRKPDHGTLIGSDRVWKEPPPPVPDASYGFDAPFNRPILERQVTSSDASVIPSNWMADGEEAASGEVVGEAPLHGSLDRASSAPDPILKDERKATPVVTDVDPAAAEPAPLSVDDDVLFASFCAGAGINPKQFAGEDRAKAMERLGGIYRQAVLGVADLMRERTSLRNEYRMVHTSVRPSENNPFKWVPPQRIAVELLRDEDSGYTTGERALNDALRDVKAHLLCMLSGMRAALGATFDALGPAKVEERLGQRNYLMAVQRDAALWAEYVAMAGALRLDADDNPDGLINRAFRQGYEEQAAELGQDSGRWR